MHSEVLKVLSIQESELHQETSVYVANMAKPTYIDSDKEIYEHLYSLEDIDGMSRELIPEHVNNDIEEIERLCNKKKCCYFRITNI